MAFGLQQTLPLVPVTACPLGVGGGVGVDVRLLVVVGVRGVRLVVLVVLLVCSLFERDNY